MAENGRQESKATEGYYFQIIDEIEQSDKWNVEPPYFIFYVYQPDVGNIPIFDFSPGGGKWWFLDEENIRWNESRTEAPTKQFEKLGRQIAGFQPAVSNHLYPEEVTHKGQLNFEKDDLEPLPQYEVDLLNNIRQTLSEGQTLPLELRKYLQSLREEVD